MEFKCDKNHVWNALPSNILKGSWCDTCYIESQRGYTIESINEMIKNYNGYCMEKSVQELLKICNGKIVKSVSELIEKI